ncbi:MAG: DUF309 domain-containing protein [Euryarchaeota archaeon]|nr:DUF309 domain-containing protein [Euryarchaeota archaeon]
MAEGFEPHREGAPLESAEVLPEQTLATLLDRGIALFDSGRHWHAHEAWEEAWRGAPPAEQAFFQGLIHVAAALVHHAKGNPEGFRLQTDKMRARLGGYAEVYRHVHLRVLVDAVLALPPPGTKADYPVVPRDQ